MITIRFKGHVRPLQLIASKAHLLSNTKEIRTKTLGHLPHLVLISPSLSLMELDTKFRENLASQPILLSDNYLESYMKDDFSFEAPSSKGFLQEIHHLDQFQTNGSSLNPIFGVQTQWTSTDFDIYECKPFMDNGGHSHVMDNFQSGGYLNLPQRNPIDIMGSDRSHMVFTTCQDIIKPLNFVVPDEVSSITAENGYYKKIATNKNRAFPTTKKPQKGRKKSNVVKGQWTVEEDRYKRFHSLIYIYIYMDNFYII